MQTQTWDKAKIHALLDSNDRALVQALYRIHARQTTEERSALRTIEHNQRGFTGIDAEFLSGIAERLPKYGDRLTPRQLPHVRKKMRKYWRQLLEEIAAKGGSVNFKVSRKKTKTPSAITPMVSLDAVGRSAQFALF
jgi:hypothetical protein